MQENIDRFKKKYAPYLKEIRRRLIFFLYFFVSSFLVSFALSGTIIRFAFHKLAENNIQIVVVSPFQFFTVAFHLSLFLAIFTTFPLAVYLTYSFLKSALTKRERKIMAKFSITSLVFFLVGFAFGLSIMYYAIIYLAGFNTNLGLVNMWNVGIIISQMLLASVLLGVYFQYPLVLTVLLRLGIISTQTLRKKRRIMAAATIIIVSILPPPEIIATIVMLVPLLAMYEMTIFLNRNCQQKTVDIAYNNKIN